jgi:hypothetical protein
MKNKRALSIILSLILSLTVLVAAGAVTAFAVGEEEQQSATESHQENPPADTPVADVTQQEKAPVDQQPADQPAEQPAEQPQAQPETSAPGNGQLYEYIYGYSEDVTSAYEEPQHLSDLPEVSPSEVVEATAVVIPEVAVSDATMFSGIVMWLCVALGIAVIVGVLVSKRTLRRGL